MLLLNTHTQPLRVSYPPSMWYEPRPGACVPNQVGRLNKIRAFSTRGAAGAALCLAFAVTSCAGVTYHRDGEGPMASIGDPETRTTVTVIRVPGVESWSFGSMFLCLQAADQSALVERVQPHDKVGSGFQLAGVLIHDFTFTKDETPIISVEGYPPVFPSGTTEPAGYVVDVPCTRELGSRRIELIVGLTATGPEGGGWLGADVSYSIAGRKYVLEIANDMLICGTATAEACAVPSDAPPSP